MAVSFYRGRIEKVMNILYGSRFSSKGTVREIRSNEIIHIIYEAVCSPVRKWGPMILGIDSEQKIINYTLTSQLTSLTRN